MEQLRDGGSAVLVYSSDLKGRSHAPKKNAGSKNVWSGDRVAQDEQESEPRWNDRDRDAVWKSSCGGDKAKCHWKNGGNTTWQKFQQREMHERRRQSLSRDSVNDELVETDDGEGRSYVANVP